MRLLSKRSRSTARHVVSRSGAEDGNAQVEFIGIVAIFVIPLVYAIVSFSQLQAAQYAVTSAAHAIARATALGQDQDQDHVRLIALLALNDQGFEVADEHLVVQTRCATGCDPATPVSSSVRYSLAVPGLGWTGTRQIVVEGQGSSYRGVLQSNEG